MCGGPGIFCCFQLRWSARCYIRGYCYELGLSLFLKLAKISGGGEQTSRQ